MPVAKIAKAWQNLALSKRRCKHELPWLSWGEVDPEEEGEPSTAAMELNCPIIYVMFEQLESLQVPLIKATMKLAPLIQLAVTLCYSANTVIQGGG